MALQEIIKEIVKDTDLHCRWLNTLSLMENTGARKISASEHKTEVTLLVLKHAAEEHRHAYYLKRQISRLAESNYLTYADDSLLAPVASRNYLNRLDLEVCKYLKTTLGLQSYELKFAAYLLVTYAIEVRADALYPIYQAALDEVKSKVNVKSIILEEEGHLEEMLHQLKSFSINWEVYAETAVAIETRLFEDWITAVKEQLKHALTLA
ncbi:hypothetical protein [Adhaeribacter aquaticus]|uniref:hypothetical protein n=1 Tax=Adhaeribacter aquaticus TaxID=299567 RepID=UPI0004023C24|nr:hypothetical protein [Adhaeribacter aquaticus]